MLNTNPAMRPSAAQLLQHERLQLVARVAEAEKMCVPKGRLLVLFLM